MVTATGTAEESTLAHLVRPHYFIEHIRHVSILPFLRTNAGSNFFVFRFFLITGVVVGINAISGISREMREQSQEREIQRERSELSEARMRQAELEGRIRAMEAAQYSR